MFTYILACRYGSSMHFFFFNDTATTEIYTLSLHDALPILNRDGVRVGKGGGYSDLELGLLIEAGLVDDSTTIATTVHPLQDRKSTRLNSSHANISYAVFCLKKKKNEPKRSAILSYITCNEE